MARGPAYPFIGLEQSVLLARKLYDYSKRAPANLNAVLKEKWDYSPTSSSAVKIVAALKYFGLIESVPPGDKAEAIKITDRAYRILIDTPASMERKQALQSAFLSPKAYKMCWDQWGPDLPDSMRSSLIFNEGFMDSTVDAFLTNYKKSMQFAGLLEAGELEKQLPNSNNNEDDEEKGEVVRSDRTVARTSTQASAPIQQHPVVSAGSSPEARPPKGAGMRQEIFALAEGDVTIQWPERLSADSLADFTDWLRILERKIKRNSIPPALPQTPIEAPLEDDDL